METITVRRWVSAPPETVWPRVFDLERLVIDDPSLDLEQLVGDGADDTVPAIGTVATVSRRRGHRVERLELHIEQRDEPVYATVALSAGGERWLVTISIQPLPGSGCDVVFHAERDPVGVAVHAARSLAGARSHRVAHSLGLLLDGLARQLEDLTVTSAAT